MTLVLVFLGLRKKKCAKVLLGRGLYLERKKEKVATKVKKFKHLWFASNCLNYSTSFASIEPVNIIHHSTPLLHSRPIHLSKVHLLVPLTNISFVFKPKDWTSLLDE